MGGYKLDLGVSNSQILKEFESGISVYKLSKKYNVSYNVIKIRVRNSGGTIIKKKNTLLWSKSEDNILIGLRDSGYSSREISHGLFHRSLKGVCNRAIILRRDRKVI